MKVNCEFCRIAKKQSQEYQNRVIFDDGIFIGMLTSYPQTKGHLLIFPKKHFSELSEMKNLAGNLMETSISLAEKIVKKLGAKAYVLRLNNKVFQLENNPLHIGHIHMHVIPRYSPNENIYDEPKRADVSVLKNIKKSLS